jgi:7-dehydrocholesterol reductase
MYKGLHYPSTQDNGSSGSLVKDFLWGTELYPRVFGLDLKRFINCRFSMTFWQLAGFSFCSPWECYGLGVVLLSVEPVSVPCEILFLGEWFVNFVDVHLLVCSNLSNTDV